MLTRTFGLALALTFIIAMPSLASDRFEPYSDARLAALQSEGHPVLVEVYADWCSTCRRQSPILEEILGEDEFSHVVALKLDWDAQRSEARALGAPRQSTLFVFRDGKRIGMSVAETDEQRLRAFLDDLVTTAPR